MEKSIENIVSAPVHEQEENKRIIELDNEKAEGLDDASGQKGAETTEFEKESGILDKSLLNNLDSTGPEVF